MACDIQSTLHCKSASPIQGLSVYFKPDVGDERRVFICASLSDKECDNYNGVSCKLLSPTHAEIRFSEYKNENGTFRCVMRGLLQPETQRCRWTPGAESQDGTSMVDESISDFSLGETTTFIPELENKDTSTETIIGAVFGAVVAIILVMAVGYLLFKLLKSKRSPAGPGRCSIGGSSSCIEAQKRGLKLHVYTERNGLAQSRDGTDAKQIPLLPSNSAHMPNREEVYSKTKDNMNQDKYACRVMHT